MNPDLVNKVRNIVGDSALLHDEPMMKHITFRAGGPADIFIIPENEAQLSALIKLFNEESAPFVIIGNGSNMLFTDEGYKGAVILIKDCFNYIEEAGQQEDKFLVKAGAGATLIGLSNYLLEKEYEGFEFASGIPGTIGGGLAMNAGAYGGELKDVLVSVRVIKPDGSMVTLKNEELNMRYRGSRISDENLVAVEAVFAFAKGRYSEIKAKISENSAKRNEKQPIDKPSAGSTFKRPEGHFAGKLIMDAGLSGYRVGGACVSEKHCGFVVNDKGGSASDILQVIKDVQEKVYNEYKIKLETEVKIIV